MCWSKQKNVQKKQNHFILILLFSTIKHQGGTSKTHMHKQASTHTHTCARTHTRAARAHTLFEITGPSRGKPLPPIPPGRVVLMAHWWRPFVTCSLQNALLPPQTGNLKLWGGKCDWNHVRSWSYKERHPWRRPELACTPPSKQGHFSVRLTKHLSWKLQPVDTAAGHRLESLKYAINTTTTTTKNTAAISTNIHSFSKYNCGQIEGLLKPISCHKAKEGWGHPKRLAWKAASGCVHDFR